MTNIVTKIFDMANDTPNPQLFFRESNIKSEGKNKLYKGLGSPNTYLAAAIEEATNQFYGGALFRLTSHFSGKRLHVKHAYIDNNDPRVPQILGDALIQCANKHLAGDIQLSGNVAQLIPRFSQMMDKPKSARYLINPANIPNTQRTKILPIGQNELGFIHQFYHANINQSREIDPITLNGMKQAVLTGNSNMYLAVNDANGLQAIGHVDPIRREISFLDIGGNDYVDVAKAYIGIIAHIIHENIGLDHEFSLMANHNSDHQTRFTSENPSIFKQTENELGEFVIPRSIYANIDEELAKLPMVFRQRHNGPSFFPDA